MKITWLILLLCCCCCCFVTIAQVTGNARIFGFSDQYKSENTLGEYTFGYNEDHTSGGSFRREISDRFGNKVGSYGLRIGDGRVRIVNYVADQNGFRADVVSNESGIESQDSNEFSKITKKNIYNILVPGFRYASQAPHVTFETDQSFRSFRDDVKYTPESPHITFGIDQSSSSFSDDVKYASELPPVPFETDQSSDRFSDDVNDEAGLQYDSDSNLDSQGNVFLNQDGYIDDIYRGEEESRFNINSNVDDGYAKAFSGQDKPDQFYSNEEIFDDGFDDDEYRQASETVPHNDTVKWQVQKQSDGAATSVQGATTKSSVESSNNSPSLLRKDGNVNGYSHQRSDIVNEDLLTHQSKASIVESTEHITLQDTKNSTETVKNNKGETAKGQNATVIE